MTKFTIKGITKRKSAPRALKREVKTKDQPKYELTKPMKEAIDDYTSSKENLSFNHHVYKRFQIKNLPNGTDLRRLLPPIFMVDSYPQLEGTGASRACLRTSNKIRLKQCRLKLIFAIPPDDRYQDEDRSSIFVRVAILSSKIFPRGEDAALNWDVSEKISDTLLSYGVKGATGEPQPQDGGVANNGYASTMLLPFNRRAFTVHDETSFYMNRGSLPGASIGTTENLGGHMPALEKEINLEWKCKNHLATFEDNTKWKPSNQDPFIYMSFAYVNGAQPSSAGVPFVYGMSTVKWESTKS